MFFQDKVKNALNSDKSFKVCFKEESSSCVPNSTLSIIDDKNQFVKNSKDIAECLFNIQKGNNAAGILLIIKGTICNKIACIIMKVERDSGAQLVLDEKTKTFNAEEVHDLMLTKKTKIFKVALFVKRNEFSIDYDGFLMDYQINIKDRNGTNTFFLDFMGCYPYDDPKIATKKFYMYTKEFIDTIADDLIRAKYTQDLNSYLQRNQNTINPREFANDYMKETEHKNQYKDYLESKGMEFNPYTKDNSLINSHIQRILLEFENGISILGAKGSLEKVNLSRDNTTNVCTATISSKIKKIK